MVGTSDSGVMAVVEKVLAVGVDGLGPMDGAQQFADDHRRPDGDIDAAVERVIATHKRLVTASGFVTGLGGVFTMPLTIPTDLVVLQSLSARCVAAIAHLRGYDVESAEVRSVVLLTLLGASGTAVAADIGVQIGNKAAMAALKALPGRVLIEINKKAGFRLVTAFGQRGVINLVKFVPLSGGVVGAAINRRAMSSAGSYAKRNFPAL